jgi:hypothetical protein
MWFIRQPSATLIKRLNMRLFDFSDDCVSFFPASILDWDEYLIRLSQILTEKQRAIHDIVTWIDNDLQIISVNVHDKLAAVDDDSQVTVRANVHRLSFAAIRELKLVGERVKAECKRNVMHLDSLKRLVFERVRFHVGSHLDKLLTDLLSQTRPCKSTVRLGLRVNRTCCVPSVPVETVIGQIKDRLESFVDNIANIHRLLAKNCEIDMEYGIGSYDQISECAEHLQEDYSKLPLYELHLLAEVEDLIARLEHEPLSDETILENLETLYEYHANISSLPHVLSSGVFIIHPEDAMNETHKSLTNMQDKFRDVLLSHMRGLLKKLSNIVEELSVACKVTFSSLEEYITQWEYLRALDTEHIIYITKLMKSITEIQDRMMEHGIKMSSEDSFNTSRVNAQLEELVSVQIVVFRESISLGRQGALASLAASINEYNSSLSEVVVRLKEYLDSRNLLDSLQEIKLTLQDDIGITVEELYGTHQTINCQIQILNVKSEHECVPPIIPITDLQYIFNLFTKQLTALSEYSEKIDQMKHTPLTSIDDVKLAILQEYMEAVRTTHGKDSYKSSIILLEESTEWIHIKMPILHILTSSAWKLEQWVILMDELKCVFDIPRATIGMLCENLALTRLDIVQQIYAAALVDQEWPDRVKKIELEWSHVLIPLTEEGDIDFDLAQQLVPKLFADTEGIPEKYNRRFITAMRFLTALVRLSKLAPTSEEVSSILNELQAEMRLTNMRVLTWMDDCATASILLESYMINDHV